MTVIAWLRAGAFTTIFPKVQSGNAANFLMTHEAGRVCQVGRTPVLVVFEEEGGR